MPNTLNTETSPNDEREIMKKKESHIFDIFTHSDQRGKLSVVEGDAIPFDIKRIYYLYNVPDQEMRGVHGHLELQQVMICMHGSVKVSLHDGLLKKDYILDDPSKGLYVPPMSWRELNDFTNDAVCVVLASMPYMKEDYIFDFNEFLETANKKNKGKQR